MPRIKPMVEVVRPTEMNLSQEWSLLASASCLAFLALTSPIMETTIAAGSPTVQAPSETMPSTIEVFAVARSSLSVSC